MALRSFTVGPAKGLRHAAWDELPNFVVIAGPNGAGKSTLLHQLYIGRDGFVEPGTNVLYLGPHRPWRKSVLSGAAMYDLQISYRQILERHGIPRFQNSVPRGLELFQYVRGTRTPDTSDETYSFVKHSIAKLGFYRQKRVERVFDEHKGMIPKGAIPDIFEPLREITRYLLPHLQFERVDFGDDQNITVLFRWVDGDEHDYIDIDDLSSGEKAIVSLLLPFVEMRINALLGREEANMGSALPTAMIDEPDLHLHPTLQVSLVEYMRGMAENDEAQFIITTHSPTILDALRDDELFLVAPVASVGDGNQFLRVTASEERLEAMRELTGSTYRVTRLRPIVFIEGDHPAIKGISDQRIMELLMPEAASWVLVPVGARTEALRSARSSPEGSVISSKHDASSSAS